ncbi:MAG: transcriptional repressor [Syntrophorhabdaceae bacterium]|nr:transcriptional repressor [Syntrophorhabdaceae bacterium]
MKKTRNTRQRGVILGILQETREHPTAEKIYQNARQIIPNISLGTVYRNLNFLQNQGLVREIHSCYGSSTRFDGILAPHAHFHCVRCGILFDIALPQGFEQFQLNQMDMASTITSIDLNIMGECAKCAPCSSFTTEDQGSTH